MNILLLIIIIGTVIAITGLILFIRGIGNGEASKLNFFGAEVESKAPSLLIFVVGAAMILYSYTNRNKADNPAIHSNDIQAQMDSIGSTGWIFLGYYDDGVHKFTGEPVFTVFRTAYNPQPDTVNLHKGDIVMLLKKRRVIIVGYKTEKQKYTMNPPLADLTDNDYTGVILPEQTKIAIEDISITRYPNDPYAVWVRARLE